MLYRHTIDATNYVFDDLRDPASPRLRRHVPATGLPAFAADSAAEMIAARLALANVPLKQFLDEPVIPMRTTRSPG